MHTYNTEVLPHPPGRATKINMAETFPLIMPLVGVFNGTSVEFSTNTLQRYFGGEQFWGRAVRASRNS